jgi:hypothetical protein
MKLVEMQKKIETEAHDNPDATLTSISLSSLEKIYTLEVRRKTNVNAIKAAIEIYLMKAKTDKLPDAVPAGLPGDLFSGKSFEYKKTADGFILRCQGEELASTNSRSKNHSCSIDLATEHNFYIIDKKRPSFSARSFLYGLKSVPSTSSWQTLREAEGAEVLKQFFSVLTDSRSS